MKRNNTVHSDTLVFFGATGDLAYKKIFPALQAMVRRGTLNVPVIGVAREGWTIDRLIARAKDSLEHHGGVDPAAFDKLCGLLRFVSGDYNDPTFYKALCHEIGEAELPAYYLAIPPAAFGTVVEQLSRTGCTRNGRVIIFAPNRLYPFETHGAFFGGRYVFGNIPLIGWLPDSLRAKFAPHVRAYRARDLRALFAGVDGTMLIHTQIYPGYDKLARRSEFFAQVLRRITYFLEATPLRAFGLSHFVVWKKGTRQPLDVTHR